MSANTNTQPLRAAPAIEHYPLDARRIAQDFPILKQKIHGGKRLVYLDSAASSQKPFSVIDAMNEYYHTSHANVHRGLHVLAERATEIYECARTRTHFFINAFLPGEVIWTKNATEAINVIAHGYGRKYLKSGDEVVISRLEHHANIVPWHQLAKDKGVVVRALELNPDGTLRLEVLDGFLATGKVKLVALAHVSNVLGTINPIAEIAQKVKQAGAIFVVDGCQAAPHMPVDVQALGCDFYVFSSHKMLGPTGLGVLWGRMDLLTKMDPFMGGGEMIDEVRLDGFTCKEPPSKFEAGTPPIAETAGHTAALEYLMKLGMAHIREHELDIVSYTLERLKSVKGLKVFGPPQPEQRAAVFAFEFEDIHAHDVAQVLDAEGIAVRAGHHCAQPLHEWLGSPSSARASAYLYTTKEDIDALIKGLEVVRKTFA